VIIDAHVHIGTTTRHLRAIQVTVEDILRDMDACAVDMAVLCPAGADLAVHNRRGNDRVAAAVRAHPDRFIGLGTANPWYGQAALVELDRAVNALGLRGFKFHSLIQGFHLNDPTLVYPVVEKAIELDVPIYFHCGTPIMAVPYKIQDLAQLYPEAKLIMGHRGWDFHFDVIHVEQNCPDLWIETSKCEYVNLEHSYQMGNAHRLLFGSDYPVSAMASELSKVRLLAGLTSEDESAILGGNCQRLFGMGEHG
jgi:predicted TIM-barrel fold metal-dependent hydrolase